MQAFYNQESIKQKYLKRAKAHYEAGETKGIYRQKGCAVGCTHGNRYEEYVNELQIPRLLARVQDNILLQLPNHLAKEFPLKFLSSIKTGADLSEVWPKFAHWLLVDENHGVIKCAKNEDQKKYINLIAQYDLDYKNISISKWRYAAKAAVKAAASAYGSASVYSSVHSSDSAYGSSSSSAYAAASYASSSVSAPDSDLASAYASASVHASASAYAFSCASDIFSFSAAGQKHYIIQAEKLIQLLNECE